VPDALDVRPCGLHDVAHRVRRADRDQQFTAAHRGRHRIGDLQPRRQPEARQIGAIFALLGDVARHRRVVHPHDHLMIRFDQ